MNHNLCVDYITHSLPPSLPFSLSLSLSLNIHTCIHPSLCISNIYICTIYPHTLYIHILYMHHISTSIYVLYIHTYRLPTHLYTYRHSNSLPPPSSTKTPSLLPPLRLSLGTPTHTLPTCTHALPAPTNCNRCTRRTGNSRNNIFLGAHAPVENFLHHAVEEGHVLLYAHQRVGGVGETVTKKKKSETRQARTS